MKTLMNAAVYHSFGGPICLQDVPIPLVPADDGVLIEVKATGVCRSDWHGWKGHDGDIRNHGLPFIPGHEVSGVVVESTSADFRPGDRVAIPFILSCGCCTMCHEGQPTVCMAQEQPGFTQHGSFAQYLALPRASRNLRHLPEQVSFIQAAALGCRFTTAYRAVLQQGKLQSDETVAIFGCGGLGLSCIMMAAFAKATRIIAIDISSEALDKAKELGATDIVLARDGEEISYGRARVLEITNGEGAHVSIDAAGFKDTCQDAIYCTRRGGRMVQVGLPIGDAPEIPMGLVAGRELQLIGSHGFNATDLPSLLDMVASGELDPLQLVVKLVSLKEGAQTLEDMDKASPLGMTVINDFGRD